MIWPPLLLRRIAARAVRRRKGRGAAILPLDPREQAALARIRRERAERAEAARRTTPDSPDSKGC